MLFLNVLRELRSNVTVFGSGPVPAPPSEFQRRSLIGLLLLLHLYSLRYVIFNVCMTFFVWRRYTGENFKLPRYVVQK